MRAICSHWFQEAIDKVPLHYQHAILEKKNHFMYYEILVKRANMTKYCTMFCSCNHDHVFIMGP